MEELISKLVREYQADMITWHDIQDIVGAYVMKQVGGGVTTEVTLARFHKANTILQEIERRMHNITQDWGWR